MLAFLLLPQEAAAGDQRQPPPDELEEQLLIPDPRSAALARVTRYLDDTKSLKAGFVQQAPSGNQITGNLYLARPGRIRFDYGDAAEILVVADGETLNFIDYEIGQVTRWPIADTPLRVLLGKSVDLARYGASIEIAPGGIPDLIALQASDPNQPELGEIKLYFEDLGAGVPLVLTGWSVVDAQGGLTVISLKDHEKNINLDDKLWTFDDPRGLAKRRRRRP